MWLVVTVNSQDRCFWLCCYISFPSSITTFFFFFLLPAPTCNNAAAPVLDTAFTFSVCLFCRPSSVMYKNRISYSERIDFRVMQMNENIKDRHRYVKISWIEMKSYESRGWERWWQTEGSKNAGNKMLIVTIHNIVSTAFSFFNKT